jgi:hypothetical protein
VSGIWSAGFPSVPLESDGILIILVKHVVLQNVPLHSQELLGPDGVRQVVTRTHQFGFCGALHIQLLFGRLAHHGADAALYYATRVALNAGGE